MFKLFLFLLFSLQLFSKNIKIEKSMMISSSEPIVVEENDTCFLDGGGAALLFDNFLSKIIYVKKNGSLSLKNIWLKNVYQANIVLEDGAKIIFGDKCKISLAQDFEIDEDFGKIFIDGDLSLDLCSNHLNLKSFAPFTLSKSAKMNIFSGILCIHFAEKNSPVLCSNVTFSRVEIVFCKKFRSDCSLSLNVEGLSFFEEVRVKTCCEDNLCSNVDLVIDLHNSSKLNIAKNSRLILEDSVKFSFLENSMLLFENRFSEFLIDSGTFVFSGKKPICFDVGNLTVKKKFQLLSLDSKAVAFVKNDFSFKILKGAVFATNTSIYPC